MMLLFFSASSWFEHIKIPPSPPTSLCYSPPPSLPPPASPASPLRALCLREFSGKARGTRRHLCGRWSVKRPRETGPGDDMTGADRRKGSLSCCITGRATHHVPLEAVTWGTADVASIDQPPACSPTTSWSRDWQVLVASSFMHCLLLFCP